MAMGLGEFAVAEIIGGGGAIVGIGGALMLSRRHRRPALVCFYIAGALFWLSGIMWGATASDYQMSTRLISAALVGGASAAFVVWIVAITNAAQITELPIAGDRLAQNSITQNNQGAPNINVPGSGNTLNVYPPASPPQNARDPDGVYQFGRQVGSIELPTVDQSSSTVSFSRINGAVNLDIGRDFEYRDFRLHIDRMGAEMVSGVAGQKFRSLANVFCKIVGRTQ